MSFRWSVLGSGSSGNTTLMSCGEEEPFLFLCDAGFSVKETQKRMDKFNISIEDLDAILLTHLDTDHFRKGWLRTCRKHNITIYLHKELFPLWNKLCGLNHRDILILFEDEKDLTPSLRFSSVRLPHDVHGSVGYVIQYKDWHLGYLTDLGRVPPNVLSHFEGLDALAIESNYDPDLQRRSPRPMFLKQRITSGKGHISNQESLDAVQHIAAQSQLQQLVLLHLSSQCNDPDIIERMYRKQAPTLHPIMRCSKQHYPTDWLTLQTRTTPRTPKPSKTLTSQAPQQLMLF
ncbi:MAG TPA: hypothetical protein DCE42_22070 [Myxococcales bacterium]|nr:hypothetical protein [Deltaproteobacteria bacterium]HAA57468.1 hypothetical protein [Myxococcales bacterium]